MKKTALILILYSIIFSIAFFIGNNRANASLFDNCPKGQKFCETAVSETENGCIPNGDICLNIKIGGLSHIDLKDNPLGTYVDVWYRFVIGSVGILATVMIMWAGFKWLTSRGNAGTIGESKEIIWSAITGLLLAFLSFTILSLINPELLKIGLPDLGDVEIQPQDIPICCIDRNTCTDGLCPQNSNGDEVQCLAKCEGWKQNNQTKNNGYGCCIRITESGDILCVNDTVCGVKSTEPPKEFLIDTINKDEPESVMVSFINGQCGTLSTCQSENASIFGVCEPGKSLNQNKICVECTIIKGMEVTMVGGGKFIVYNEETCKKACKIRLEVTFDSWNDKKGCCICQ